MSASSKKSFEPFRYDKGHESKLGKRTGAYVRKSNIRKDFDGLQAMSEYWETTTEKTFGTTDDIDTSMTSDINIDVSETSNSNPTSPVSKGTFGTARRRRQLQLSSQKGTLFDDIMTGSQVQTIPDAKDSSYIQPYAALRRERVSPIENHESDDETGDDDSLLRGLSASKLSRSYVSGMTHITRTPSVSVSIEEESAKKNLEELLKRTDEYSDYYNKLKEDKSMEMMRTHLRKIQEDSKLSSGMKSQDRDSESPVGRKLNLNFLDKEEDSPHQRKSVNNYEPDYPGDDFFTQVSIQKDPKSRYSVDNEEISPEKPKNDFLKHITKRGNKSKETKAEIKNEPELELAKKGKKDEKSKLPDKNSKETASKDGTKSAKEEATIKKEPSSPKQGTTIGKENNKKSEKISHVTQEEQDLKNIIQKSMFERNQASKQSSKQTSVQNSDNKPKEDTKLKPKASVSSKAEPSQPKASDPLSPSRKKKIEIPKKNSTKESSPPPKKSSDNRGKSSDEKKKSLDPPKSKSEKDNSDKAIKISPKTQADNKRKSKSPSPKSKPENRRKSNSSVKGYNNYDDYGNYDAGNFDQDPSPSKQTDRHSSSKKSEKSKNLTKESSKEKPEHKRIKKDEKDSKKDSAGQKKVKVELKEKSRGKSSDEKAEKDKPSKKKNLKNYEEHKAVTRPRKRKRLDKFIEAYELAIGAKDLHLIEEKIESNEEFFAGGRYPKRNRVPKLCFWKNERPVYSNLGHGIELVGIVYDGDAIHKPLNHKTKTHKERGSSEKKLKVLDKERSKSLKEEKDKKVVSRKLLIILTEGKMFDNDDEDDPENSNLEDQRVPALDKMNFEYKVVGEDKETISVFLKIRPGNEKEPQKNVAGAMQCTIIKCEEGKAEAICGDKKYTLGLNDKFVIPSKSVYSIKNKSRYKDLEISCHILK